MYSPKIKEDLVAKLYRRAKVEGVPMTKLVDRMLRDGLKGEEKYKGKKNEVEE